MSHQPKLHSQRLNGAELAYAEWGEACEALPSLLFVHATGFHGRVWDRIIEAFEGFHVIALDQRGHGRSEKLATDDWKTYGDDLAALALALKLDSAIGIGHSMGGHALVDGAAQAACFSQLLLLDPTIFEPARYQAVPPTGNETKPDQHPTERRRDRFASIEEMMERLAAKSSFPLFDPRMFRDYCTFGLTPTGDGDLQLACPPAIEAQIYKTATSNARIYNSVAALSIPAFVVRAQEGVKNSALDFSVSPTWTGLASAFASGRELHLADCSHFIPMERPDQIIAILRGEIAEWAQ